MESQTSKFDPPARGTLLRLLNDRQVADFLGVSLATVRRWRLLGQGPRYLKLGASCKYKVSDVAAWLESRPSGGEQPAA
jgi:predicted DNA-binding transcriptional regulator AlpA